MFLLKTIWLCIRALFMSDRQLKLENLALRQQLAIYERKIKKPKLRRWDRIFWVWLSRCWNDWASALIVVRPETVVAWHRQGFRLYWRWKSQAAPVGRPRIDAKVVALIRRMSRENPTWGVPRIQAELRLLGHDLAESTVAKYRVKTPKPPSQTWRNFLANHMNCTAAVDFFTVPTATFRVLYGMVVMRHDRRQVVHYNITDHPTAEWATQQVREAFPFETAPRFLVHDNDATFTSAVFQGCLKSMGIESVKTAWHSPWQNAYCERLIGSIRRDCLDHVIVLGERHLKRTLASYFDYYHTARVHMSLDRNAPVPRPIEPPEQGEVTAIPYLGGLHHRYTRRPAA